MLVLSRRIGEKIRVGNTIEIQVVRILPDRVQIGVSAPKEIPVFRQEVWDRIQEEGKAA